jgi:hypothetical protein
MIFFGCGRFSVAREVVLGRDAGGSMRAWSAALFWLAAGSAELLFQVLTERGEKASVAIASNESFSGGLVKLSV